MHVLLAPGSADQLGPANRQIAAKASTHGQAGAPAFEKASATVLGKPLRACAQSQPLPWTAKIALPPSASRSSALTSRHPSALQGSFSTVTWACASTSSWLELIAARGKRTQVAVDPGVGLPSPMESNTFSVHDEVPHHRSTPEPSSERHATCYFPDASRLSALFASSWSSFAATS